jgi:hypothetical protein
VIDDGDAVNVLMAGGSPTLTVTVAVAVPDALAAVRVYVVVVLGDTETVLATPSPD